MAAGVSLVPGDGAEDAGCDGVSLAVEGDSSLAGAPVLSPEGDAESGDTVLLPDGPTATSEDLPGKGVAEPAAARPSRTLRSTVPPSVPSSVPTCSSTCLSTPPATRPTASSGLAIGLSDSGASINVSPNSATRCDQAVNQAATASYGR